MKLAPIFSVLAIGLALVLPSESRAVVIYYPMEDIAIPNTFDGVSVDLETGANSTSASGVSGGDANFFFGGEGISNDADVSATSATWQPVRTGTGNTDAIQNLAFGTTIDASTSSYSSGFGSSGQVNSHFGGATGFTSGTPGYIGFSLVLDNSQTVYGWAYVTLYNDGQVGTLHEWAFDDSGAAIDVGVVPEAATGTLLLLAAGFALVRRRQSERHFYDNDTSH